MSGEGRRERRRRLLACTATWLVSEVSERRTRGLDSRHEERVDVAASLFRGRGREHGASTRLDERTRIGRDPRRLIQIRTDQGKRGPSAAGPKDWSQPVRHLVDFRQCGS